MPSADFLLLGPAWTCALCFLVFMIGACAGSFTNCLAWRLLNGESVLKGRSHCVSCNYELGALDLVPVFSWLFLRGNCRHCGARVAFRYVAAEIICGLYFLSIAWFYGLSVHTLLVWILGCILLGLSLCDLERFIIPNGFIIAGLLVWVLDVMLSTLIPWEDFAVDCFPILFDSFIQPTRLAIVVEGLIAAVFISAFMLLMTSIVSRRKGVDSMGGGDFKLFFVVSLFLGLLGAFFNIIVCCVVGLVLGVVLKVAVTPEEECLPLEDPEEKLRQAETVEEIEAMLNDDSLEPGSYQPPKGAFPFGPAIALGTWISLIAGPGIVNAYLSLIYF